MCKVYGYCRISTPKQNIERQVRNILQCCPEAQIIKETYTGTKSDRPEWNRILKAAERGDIKKIIFDNFVEMYQSVPFLRYFRNTMIMQMAAQAATAAKKPTKKARMSTNIFSLMCSLRHWFSCANHEVPAVSTVLSMCLL